MTSANRKGAGEITHRETTATRGANTNKSGLSGVGTEMTVF